MAVEALGTFAPHGEDHIDVRFVRHYPRPVETVWSAITEPARLADWMGAAQVEPRVGGRIALMTDGPGPMTGVVRAWEPPHLLEFTWSNTHAPDSVVRYELSPEAGGTRLTFTHTSMPYVTCALMLPGWHELLGRLGRAVTGAPPRDPPDWFALQGQYVERYGLTGVMLTP
jgi:uncharacterized protein YndB with AHSA1/START domain